MPFLAEIAGEFDAIPPEKLSYLQERFRNRLYDLIVGEFLKHNAENPLFTQAALARRIGSRPDVVNRWLSSPGNWTTDTISNLLAGICGAELGITIDKLYERPTHNYTRPEWLDSTELSREIYYTAPPPAIGSITFDMISKCVEVEQ